MARLWEFIQDFMFEHPLASVVAMLALNAVVIMGTAWIILGFPLRFDIASGDGGQLYHDDGRGLVLVDIPGTMSGEKVYAKIRAWRDDHPDRFRRHVGIAVDSRWHWVIISYVPAPVDSVD